MELTPHPRDLYDTDQNFMAACRPQDLIYFVLNVGNADTQLILLPEDAGVRHMVIVDVGRVAGRKVVRLIQDLADPAIGAALLNDRSRIRLLVATHPHDDHVAGIPDLLDSFGHLVEAIWDSGYFYRTAAWHEMMRWLEQHPDVDRLHPTSGTRIHIGECAITALSPAIALRNNYDTRGVYINNASIAAQIEFPVTQIFTGNPDAFATGRQQAPIRRRSLLLGADAQTMSWSHVDVDFPTQAQERSVELQRLGLGSAKEPLRSDVFKIPHHCSKNGLNLELVSRVNPMVSIVSSAASNTSHAFPHAVALEQLREALQPIAGSGGQKTHKLDPDLGIYFTADHLANNTTTPTPLGTIAVIMPPTGHNLSVYRFGDRPGQRITADSLTSAHRVSAVPSRSARTA